MAAPPSPPEDAGGFWLILAASRCFGLLPLGLMPSLRPVLMLRVYCVLRSLLVTIFFGFVFTALTNNVITLDHNNATPFAIVGVLYFFIVTVAMTTVFFGSIRKMALLRPTLTHPIGVFR